MKPCPVSVDPKITCTPLPVTQDDHPGRVLQVQMGSMNMPEHHQVDSVVERARVPAKRREMAAIIGLARPVVRAVQCVFQAAGERSGQVSEAGQERAAFHYAFPGRARAHEVPVGQVKPRPVRAHLEDVPRLDAETQPFRIIWAEPRIVVSQQDRHVPPPALSVRQGPEAVAFVAGIGPMPTGEPEVAQVADDEQSVVPFEGLQKPAQPCSALGTVGTKVKVAYEVVGHGRDG